MRVKSAKFKRWLIKVQLSRQGVKRGQRSVDLPLSLSAKVLLLNGMIAQKVRPAELARRLQTTPQQVNRLTSIHHASKIDGIAAAMKSLGKTIEITAV